MSSSKNTPARFGEFAATALPRALLDLHRTRFDGSLVVGQALHERRFVFRRGSPIYAESNRDRDGLAAHLLHQGGISARQERAVLAHASGQGTSEGAALVALQLLEPRELFDVLRDQTRALLIDSMAWKEGRCHPVPGDPESPSVEPLRWHVPLLVHQGLVSHWSTDQLLASLSSKLPLYPRLEPGFAVAVERLALGPDPASRLLSLDSRRPVEESLGPNLASPPLLGALWVLDELGSLGFAHAPARSLDESHPTFAAEVEVALAVNTPKAESVGSPRTEARPGLTSEADAVRAEIESLRAGLTTASHYEFLGIRRDADPERIKKAYLAAAKRYHPDSLGRLGLEDIKLEASEVFSRLAVAFEVLSKDDTRRDYDAGQRGERSGSDAQKITQAETAYRKGEILLRMGDFQGALPYLASAVEIWPEEADYQSALGWALYKQSASDPERARAHLALGVELAPEDPVYQFRLGVVFRALGLDREGQSHLDRAKQLEPAGE